MGKQIKLIFVLALLFVSTIQAQEIPLSYKQADSTSYALFLKQDWKPLLKFGKKSQAAGIDFYYLKVRMGIAYFKEGKMLLAVKKLEAAYAINSFDVVVQDYLYWAYRYSGLYLEADAFYDKMDSKLKNQIKLDIPLISIIDFGLVATNNLDFDEMLRENNMLDDTEVRNFAENYQLYMFGLNLHLSNKVNFYNRITVMPRNSVIQENTGGGVTNTTFSGIETRYYGDVTFTLGQRWYLDLYLDLIFGNLEEDGMMSSTTENYSDFVFGGSLSKASYYFRNSFNMSYSNLNGYNQFQAGYTLSLYPLGNAFLVPFGSVQYQNESLDFYSESRMVYTGGIAINTKDVSFTGYINTGELRNFVANSGSVIYNQDATVLNEYGLIAQLHFKKVEFKIGYSYMNMIENNFTEDLEILPTTFEFNQQNIIAGLTWKL